MRRCILLAAVAVAGILAMCGCAKENEIKDNLAGEWHAVAGFEQIDVWIEFEQSGTFEMFQKIGEGRYYSYKGTWSVSGDVVSGKYNDLQPWGSRYRVAFSSDDRMTFTALDGSDETVAYVREEIPSDVREESIVEVKSSGEIHQGLL